jgi:hypothetical protein
VRSDLIQHPAMFRIAAILSVRVGMLAFSPPSVIMTRDHSGRIGNLLWLCLSYLEDVHIVYSCSRVSHRWHESAACQMLWNQVVLKDHRLQRDAVEPMNFWVRNRLAALHVAISVNVFSDKQSGAFLHSHAASMRSLAFAHPLSQFPLLSPLNSGMFTQLQRLSVNLDLANNHDLPVPATVRSLSLRRDGGPLESWHIQVLLDENRHIDSNLVCLFLRGHVSGARIDPRFASIRNFWMEDTRVSEIYPSLPVSCMLSGANLETVCLVRCDFEVQFFAACPHLKHLVLVECECTLVASYPTPEGMFASLESLAVLQSERSVKFFVADVTPSNFYRTSEFSGARSWLEAIVAKAQKLETLALYNADGSPAVQLSTAWVARLDKIPNVLLAESRVAYLKLNGRVQEAVKTEPLALLSAVLEQMLTWFPTLKTLLQKAFFEEMRFMNMDWKLSVSPTVTRHRRFR